MSSKPDSLAFALDILKLLAEKSLKRAEIVDLLLHKGYGGGDLQQRFDRTLRKLKRCGFTIKSAPNCPYELLDANFPMILSKKQKQSFYLASHLLLEMGFTGESETINRLSFLSEEDQPSEIRGEFYPPVDYSLIAEKIKDLQARIEAKRRYTIFYHSSQGERKLWDLDCSELRLHHGVLYLCAFIPDAPHRFSRVEQNRLFRVDRILTVNASINTCWLYTNLPTQLIYYRMFNGLKSYKPRRKHEKIVRRTEDFIEIETEEDCLFWFQQRILQYGENVKVLNPDWLVDKIRNSLLLALQNYS